MKKVIALLLILAVAGLAHAAKDKPVDNQEGGIQFSRVEINGELTVDHPVWDRGYGYNDPAPDTCDYTLTPAFYQGQHFDLFCVQSSDQNPVEFEITVEGTNLGDTTMHIFCAAFDYTLPLEQCVFYDDDDGAGLLSAILLADNVVLTPGVEYWLVISTYSAGDPDDVGTFRVVSSDNVDLCGVAVEDVDWGTIKSLFQ